MKLPVDNANCKTQQTNDKHPPFLISPADTDDSAIALTKLLTRQFFQQPLILAVNLLYRIRIAAFIIRMIDLQQIFIAFF